MHEDGEFAFKNFFTEEVYDPVYIFPRIARLIRPGDTFVVTLLFMGFHWGVLDMSPPYDEVTIH